MEMLYFAATHAGNRRKENQDSYLCLPQYEVWLVADGMGGHQGGSVASQLAVQVIKESIEAGQTLEDAIHQAHRAILERSSESEVNKSMGTTVVALESRDDGTYSVYWVGDSRAYSFSSKDSSLRQLSTDHSYVQALFQAGVIQEDEIDNHPNGNVVTQCLGGNSDNDLMVDRVDGVWSEGETLLLCSDGLSGEVGSEQIIKTFEQSRQRVDQQLVDDLVATALDAGGKDNVTAMLIKPANLALVSPQHSKPSGWRARISRWLGE